MTEGKKVPQTVSASKLALAARQARAGSADVPLVHSDPLAIVGMACRFPGGASTPSRFWRLIADGIDAVGKVPPDRWNADALYDPEPSAPGKMTIREGAFVDGVDLFDPAFFGISPREAVGMDPQQRILTEVVWEALEDGGQVPARLAGGPIGVFVAVYNSDYARMQYADPGGIDAYTTSGTAHSIAAGRISYLLDFRGPSVTVDTACSASLVAFHLACQSLRLGECDLAVTGGASLVIGPESGISLSKWGMMAPDGRCKTFDARADGFGRGEGCGVVLVKRLADAVRDGDRIRAIVRGTAVNQDGRSSTLTAPNGLSQQAVVRAALENGRVAPQDVTYVEAHGTGTALGDPIEVEALAEVLGRSAPDVTPCALGSVKANIGHLEAAAGIAGIIKTVLSLERGILPPLVHFRSLNPHIDFRGTRFFIPTETRPWTVRGTRLAGVSSFGFGGTNAHVVLEEASGLSGPSAAVSPPVPRLLLLSSPVDPGLRAMAERYAGWLSGGDGEELPPFDGICASTALYRTHHDHRLAVVGESASKAANRLDSWRRGEQVPGTAAGIAPRGAPPKVAFVFSGQGPQWWAMGRELLEHEPLFREAVERCDRAIHRYAGWSVLSELLADEVRSRLGETEFAQPAIFALQVGLATLWKSWGIAPDAVTGHSVGEIAAAHVAGGLDLEDAARVIALRGRLMQRATGKGRMASLDGDPRELEGLLRGFERRVSVAARNTPNTSVVTGDTEAVEAVVRNAEARGMRSRWLPVNYAFHSPQMGPLAEELSASLGTLRQSAAGVTMVSTVTAGLVRGSDLTREYWAENVRRPVRFHDAVGRLLDDGIDTFVEIAPHPVLSASILECAGDRAAAIGVVASLRRGQPERFTMSAALGTLWTRGVAIDWSAFLGDAGPPVSLPPYAWQRKRFWLAPRRVDRTHHPETPGSVVHPLLGRRLDSPLLPKQFEAEFDSTVLPFVSDHRVLGSAVLPATAFIETALAAAPEILGPGEYTIESLELERLLAPAPGEPCIIQNVIYHAGPDAAILEVHSRGDAPGEPWKRHARARLIRESGRGTGNGHEDLDEAAGRCGDVQEGAAFYETMGRAGIEFGPRFRGIDRICLGGRDAVAAVSRPRVLVTEQDRFHFHPALLDAFLQPLGWLCLRSGVEGQGNGLFLPVAMERVRVRTTAEDRFRVHASLRGLKQEGEDEIADVRVYDAKGRFVASLEGVRLHRTPLGALTRLLTRVKDDLVYDLDWKPAPPAMGRRKLGGCWLVLTGADPLGERIVAALSKECRVVTVSPGRGFREIVADRYEVDPTRSEDLDRVIAAVDGGPDPLCGSVSLWATDFGLRPSDDADSLERAQALLCGGALHLVQALAKRSIGSGFRLLFVTRGVQAVGPGAERVEPAQSPLWGFGSVVALENPALGARLVDLGRGSCEEEEGALLSEIFSGDGEPKVALRASGRYVPRLARRNPQDLTGGGPQVDPPVQVMIRERGELGNLQVCPMERRPPGPGEVEVRVGATGLNFRDVMNALGTYPGDAGPLGDECSGVVRAVGPGVEELLPGDEVMGFVPAAFGSFVTAPADLFVKRPERLSREEAAATPIAFLTAEYALAHLGRLQAGERVLIHAAAGGVGLAAVQLAQRAGGEVFATAGSPEKRAYLASLGVRHVMDSRSTAFTDEVLAATGGDGVDVVLNSLAGEFIPRSLAVLKTGGRFLELGRTGVWSDREVAALGRGLRYEVVFLGILRKENPKLIRELLRGIADGMSRGTLRPLPVKAFEQERVVEAFRFMAQARHIGKIVVRHPAATASTTRAGDAVRPDATYIVTGGAGALGLQVARLLVERGARSLLLVGRSAPGDAALREISRLEQAGARVALVRADVANEEDCDRLVRLARDGWPPVRGVVHAAGVVEDATLGQQTLQGFLRVLKPKVLGAWNLHRRLAGDPLDFFVLFSSVASLFGSAGQANYAAANAFLDAFAHDRRAAGLPAMSINWGPWAGAGMAASLGDRDQRRLEGRGMRPLRPEEGREALGRLLDGGGAQAVVASMNWAQAVAESEGMRRIASEIGDRSAPSPPPGGAEHQPTGFWVQGLRDAPGSRRRTMLVQHLRELVARVFGLDTQAVETTRPLREIGLDSLLAVELRNAVGREVEKSLPAALLFDYPTVDALANHLLADVLGLDDSPAAGNAAAARGGETVDGLKDLEPLSEEETEALLLKELGSVDDGARNG